jgi:hypothetical protein
MKDQEAIDKLNGFTQIQKGYFNVSCDNKTHTIKTNGRITQSEIDDANDVATHIDGMTQANIDSNISPSLNDTSKLSGRPC